MESTLEARQETVKMNPVDRFVEEIGRKVEEYFDLPAADWLTGGNFWSGFITFVKKDKKFNAALKAVLKEGSEQLVITLYEQTVNNKVRKMREDLAV